MLAQQQRSVLISLHLWKFRDFRQVIRTLIRLAETWSQKDHEVCGDTQSSIVLDGVVVGKIIYFDPSAPMWEVLAGTELVCLYRGTCEKTARMLYESSHSNTYLLRNSKIQEEHEAALLTNSIIHGEKAS